MNVFNILILLVFNLKIKKIKELNISINQKKRAKQHKFKINTIKK